MSDSANNSFRNALFSAHLRSEVVTLKNGVQVKIKQVTAAVGDRINELMRDERVSNGERYARMVNFRCENPDGSAILTEADCKTYSENVAADSPLMVEVMEKIQEFDKQTAKLYDETQGK